MTIQATGWSPRALRYRGEVTSELREGYLEIARSDTRRIAVLPAEEPPDAVHARILQTVEPFLERRERVSG